MRGDSRTAEIKKALEQTILSSVGESDLSLILENVMSTLDKQKLLRYHSDGELSLLSTPGRVLIALCEDPTMTQRALAVYLDLSETMIDKTIKSLTTRGLITKTKVNRQNHYKINLDEVKMHPDIRHFADGIISRVAKANDLQRNENKNYVPEVVSEELF